MSLISFYLMKRRYINLVLFVVLLVFILFLVGCTKETQSDEEIFIEDVSQDEALVGQAGGGANCRSVNVNACKPVGESSIKIAYSRRSRVNYFTLQNRCYKNRAYTFSCEDRDTVQVCWDICENDCENGICVIEEEEQQPICGNDVVEEGENCETCPADVSCEAGNLCQQGRCIAVPCKDSDQGRDYDVQGRTAGWEDAENPQEVVMEQDSCVEEGENIGQLHEFYCQGGEDGFNRVKSEFYECPFDCDEGRCQEIQLQGAEVLDIPLPNNAKCFSEAYLESPECSSYFHEVCRCVSSFRGECRRTSCENELVCPRHYNPVYDENGLFYPSACWAEQLGAENYNYGHSERVLQFFSDLWGMKGGSRYYEVPMPNLEFSYILNRDQTVFLRSFVWINSTELKTLEYNVDRSIENQRLFSNSGRRIKSTPYGQTIRVLLAYVIFDEAYPEEILLEWTPTYANLLNNNIAREQDLQNKINYEFIPVIISSPNGVERITQDHYEHTEEEIQLMFDAATDIVGNNFDRFVVVPIDYTSFGGHGSYFNNFPYDYCSLSPDEAYSEEDLQQGLNALSAFQSTFGCITHEFLHSLGLMGDHFPMEYGTSSLLSNNQDFDHTTGSYLDEPLNYCDYYGQTEYYVPVELPQSLRIQVGEEPEWLDLTESDSGNCLRSINGQFDLKDYDQDGEYEMMYQGHLIGEPLRRALGWIDMDGDGTAEIADPNPYGGAERIELEDEWEMELINLGAEDQTNEKQFEFIEYVQIDDCQFARVIIDDIEGLVPLDCPVFQNYITNIYNGLSYRWYVLDNEQYGRVFIAYN